ncbi:hypothetical protein LOTGIDRAFT_162560 [Lottia gigantea]|uniref:G-protein coupled receptors family 1 profile domain-containing protein n=1 Tax=Lottia gigantea TaxID=225164 RepID=V4AC11_LOTGI|nr:hypothetical protein LOTGIDRAFT_162560 [Lottia gigantea]ESO92640.1 hypothetical protein LOTGIDRAFT_162560 [Lottia gigantea]
MLIRDLQNCTDFEFCFVSDDSEYFTSQISVTSQVFAISVLILTCIIGNCLLFYAIFKCSKRSSALAILLLNLAIVDILVGVVVLPMWIVSTVNLGWPFPHNMCEFVGFLTVVLMLCSILSLCTIAVDRYCCIAFPFRYPVLVTVPRLNILVVCLWVYCILVAVFPLFGWGDYRFQPQTVPICNPVWVTEIAFAIFLVLSGIVLPVILMLFSYAKIVVIARDHIRRIDIVQRHIEMPSTVNNTSNQDQNHNTKDEIRMQPSRFSKSLKMVQKVFIAVGVFFLCWGPYVILNFWSVNNEHKAVPYVADLLVTLLAFANSSINPVIFILLNKEYRKTIHDLRNVLIGLCQTNRVIPLTHSSGYDISGYRDYDLEKRSTAGNGVARRPVIQEVPFTSGYDSDIDNETQKVS